MRSPSKNGKPSGGGRNPRGVWAAVIVAAAAVLVATVVWLLPGSSLVTPSPDAASNEQQADEQSTDTSDENAPTDQAVVGESKTDPA